MLEQSVTWREKHIPSKSWLRKWKKDAWIKHLYGQMLESSIANLGVGKWIASLEEFRVSPLVLLDNGKEKTTNDGFGMTHSTSLIDSDQNSASSKMFPAS